MSGTAGRAVWWFNAAALALAFTACCGLGVLLTSRAHARLDVTSTREHGLSARTRQVVDRIDRPLSLVVAADLASLDRGARTRVLDVLGRFESASPRLKVSLIDTSSAQGQEQYRGVIAGLAAADAPVTAAAVAAVRSIVDSAGGLAVQIEGVQGALLKLREERGEAAGSVISGQYLQTQAAVLRVAASDLRTAVLNAQQRLKQPDPVLGVPLIDSATSDLRKPLGDAARALGDLSEAFEALARDPAAGEADKAAVGAVVPLLRGARDGTGRAAAELSAVEQPRVLRIARALQLRRAALLIDEAAKPGAGVGVTAVDVDALLAADEPGRDLRARTEDLLAGAVGTMVSGVRPLVCLVHGAPTRLAALDWPMMQRARQALSVRGIDMVEWAVALDQEMPAAASRVDAARPVVFVTVTAQGGSREGTEGVAAGVAAFGGALNALVAEGRSVLLSVNVSRVPASGSADPLTQCLSGLGVRVDSGRPLLEEFKAGTRRVVVAHQDVIESGGSHGVSRALDGLPTRLLWPVSIDGSGAKPGVVVEPVVVVASSAARWAESEWQEFNRAVTQLRGDSARVSNPPAKDSPRDGSGDSSGWVLAAAVERTAQGGGRQRLMIVGSNGWFLDDFAAASADVDGRSVPVFPGNVQLLEGSVLWLAGQDDQIVRGAAASAVRTIPPLSDGAVSWLRWLLVVVLPGMVLAVGLLYRATRG